MMPAPKLKPTGMPAPKPKTFGDKRPDTTAVVVKTDWPPLPESHDLKKLLDGCNFPEIETYRQTNGPLFLFRMKYNRMWITGTGVSEEHAVHVGQQFYMNETARGRLESEKLK